MALRSRTTSASTQRTGSHRHESTTITLGDGEMETGSILVVAELEGDTPVEQQKKNQIAVWELLVIMNELIVYHDDWVKDSRFEFLIPVDIRELSYQQLLGDHPLILLLRTAGGKERKDPDPLTHPSNRAGGTVDLLPIVLGAKEVRVKVPLITPIGEEIGCVVHILATPVIEPVPSMQPEEPPPSAPLVPLVLTMVSVHCLPNPHQKPNTVCISAVGLNGVLDPPAVTFGMSLSELNAEKCLWATTCTGGQMTRSNYRIPNDDMYVPPDIERKDNPNTCTSFYWHAVKRVLIDPNLLRKRLEQGPLIIEVAEVPRTGKQNALGRFLGHIDARALLHPDQISLHVCSNLKYFDEFELSECGPLLDIPPASAKKSAKSSAQSAIACEDIHGHTPYVVIQLDLPEPLVPKPTLAMYFDALGFPLSQKRVPLNELYVEPPQEDPLIDVRKIRKESGALAVHRELSNLTCRGLVPMTEGIKKTAANKLLTRVRTMLRQFSPGECSHVEWQEAVRRQHAASRRAVMASFCPQPPPARPSAPFVAARARMAGDMRLSDFHIQTNLNSVPEHPRSQISKVLRLLEASRVSETTPHILKALESQTRNRHLLWLYGALKYESRDETDYEIVKGAFNIAVKGDYSDGVACTIGWAALHAFYHYHGNNYAAFVAAKKMRKAHELPRVWQEYYASWLETSGEEEILWSPEVVSTDNPFLTAAAHFLVLRCYSFSERLLKCLEDGCATRGSRLRQKTEITVDVHYLRAVSLLLRRQAENALEKTEKAIRLFGPSAKMAAIRASCILMSRDWEESCVAALEEAERWGSKISFALLLEAARRGIAQDPEAALQRAGRVHKERPCAYSALTVARVYMAKREYGLAEKWAAGAVKLEPLFADGWAVLALLALGQREDIRARHFLRTARQAGPISEDIQAQLFKLMKTVKCEQLADLLVNACFCNAGPDSSDGRVDLSCQ